MASVTVSQVAKLIETRDPVFVREYRRLFNRLNIAPGISEQCYYRCTLGASSFFNTVVSLLESWISECREPTTVGLLKEHFAQEDFHLIAGISQLMF